MPFVDLDSLGLLLKRFVKLLPSNPHSLVHLHPVFHVKLLTPRTKSDGDKLAIGRFVVIVGHLELVVEETRVKLRCLQVERWRLNE